MALNGAHWMHKKSGVEIGWKKWNAFVTDEFSSKPSYFEGDGPVCTRSASSFCHNPLNFLAHAMCVKWWYHAKFQPFQSSFVLLFNFRVIQRKIKSLKSWKIENEIRKCLKIEYVALNGAYSMQKKSGVKIC